MSIQWRLYDIGIIIDALEEFSVQRVREVFREYLRRGAHPFFLEQVSRFRGISLASKSRKEMERAVRDLLRKEHGRCQRVSSPWALDLLAPVSRLYEKEWAPIAGLEEGILQGAFVETIVILHGWSIQNYESPKTREEFEQLLKRFLEHPVATMGLLDNVSHQLLALAETLERLTVPRRTTDRFVTLLGPLEDAFLKEQVLDRGRTFEELLAQLLGVWNDPGAYRFWGHLASVFKLFLSHIPGESLIPTEQLPATRLLRTILDSAITGKGLVKYAAQQVLRLYPIGLRSHEDEADFLAGNCKGWLLSHLKMELPNVTAYHTIVRWLQVATFRLREIMIPELALRFPLGEAGGQVLVDERVEFLIEEIIGPEAWRAVCAFQDSKFWRHDFEPFPGYRYRGGIDTKTPEYQLFVQELKRSRIEQHNWRLAENLDVLIHNVNHEELEQAQAVSEQAINLLAGDILLVVTHLRTEWMLVRKREGEYMSVLFPVVEVARHPTLGENGAACAFRITLPEMANDPVTGCLDAEGTMTLDRICALTTQGRQVLQAVVVQTLAAVLIPRYLDKFPPRPHGGFRFFSGEVWASRPVIHRFGEVRESEDRPEPPGNTRINPVIAEWLFEWLLDIQLDSPFRLYRLREEKVGSYTDRYHQTWREAKDELYAWRVSLSEVFFRTVRAYTRPTSVRQKDNGEVEVQRMSSRAQRNYERFRQDVGRVLDFSPVRKTYVLPGGMRIVLDVPRTFNQGTFNSLQEVWEMIPDPTLKERARATFVFG